MKKENNFTYRFFRRFFYISLKILYGLKITGVENIPKDGAIIFAGNHKHAFDPTLVISSNIRPIHFIAKAVVLRYFPNGLVKKLNVIKIHMGKNNTASIMEAEKILRNGGAIGIFPEGTRNRTDQELQKFKSGTVRIAKRTNAKIVPFAIKGDYKILKRNLKIEFSEPIEVENLEIDEANNYLKKEVLEILRK